MKTSLSKLWKTEDWLAVWIGFAVWLLLSGVLFEMPVLDLYK